MKTHILPPSLRRRLFLTKTPRKGYITYQMRSRILLTILAAGMAVFAGNLDELLDGVTSVVHSPTPGPVYIFGTNAFPVLIGNASGTKLPVAGACLSGSGRIVAIGDNGFGLASSLAQQSCLSGLRWTKRPYRRCSILIS
jgi:hypothetical protein